MEVELGAAVVVGVVVEVVAVGVVAWDAVNGALVVEVEEAAVL